METIVYDESDLDCSVLLTVEEFVEDCETGLFMDYDGFGNPVKDGKMARDKIYPSGLERIPDDATHIAWFNK